MHNPAWSYCFCLYLFLSISVSGFAQRHSPCGSNPVPLSNFCTDACLVCDLNGVTAKTTNTIVGQAPPGFCTMVQHSMQWLAFIAGSTSLSFNVSVSNCTQANGVEMGVYASDDCQTFKLVSNCNTNMYANQTWPFTTTEPLKVGCIYYLVFDGNGPNACDVSFTVTSGSAAAPVPNTTNKIIGKTQVCKGATVDYSIAPINGACSYEWRVENGSINSSLDNKAQVTWDQPGFGKICVKGLNDCHAGNEVCLDVEIGDDSPPEYFGPYYVCNGGTYRFNNLTLTPGTWEYFYKNKYGCDSNITVVVEQLDLIETWIDTSLCFPDTLKIGNKTFDSTGIYKMVFKSKLAPFCDSSVFVNLNYTTLISIPNKTNDLSCQDSFSILFADSSLIPKNGKFKYLWTDKNKDTLGQGNKILVKQAGEYFLTLVHESDSIHSCISTQSIQLNGSRSFPKLVLLDSLRYCAGDTIDFTKIKFQDVNNTNASISFHYAIPCNALNRMDSSYLVLDRDSVIYLNASNANCEDAIPLAFKISQRDRAFFQDTQICYDEEIDLTALPFTKVGSFSGIPDFYYCASPDTNCAIKSPLLKLQRDTIIYAYPSSASCPNFSYFKIVVNPIPSSSFRLNKLEFCLDDTLQLDLASHDSVTKMFLKFDNIESLIGITSNVIRFALKDTGVHMICLRSERLSCTDSLCQHFKVFPPPEIPIIDCIATDSSILFNWKFHSDETYSIDVLQGGNYTRLSDTSAFFANLNRGETVKIKVRASNPFCPERTNDLECQSKTCPPVQLDIVPVDTICLDAVMKPFFLNATTNPNQTNGVWRWRGPGIVDSLTALFDPQLAGPGNHRIFCVLDQNGCKYFANTTIVVRENPISDFSLDSVVCQDSTTTILFKGYKADSANFNWNFDGGIYKFINANRDLEIKWNTPGKKFLRLKLNHYKCFNESSKEIEVLEPLPKPIINCESTDSNIIFKWNSIKRVKKYKIAILKGNSGQFIDDTTFVIQKRFFNDSSSIQLTLEDEGPCSEVLSDVMDCKSPDCPPRNLLADTVLNYCFTNHKTVQLNQFIRDPVKLFHWSGDSIQNNSINTGKLKSGTYQYIIHGNDFGCIYDDTLNLNIHPSPKILSFDVQKIPCDPLNRKGSIRFNQVLSTLPPISYSLDGIIFQSDPEFKNIPGGYYRLFAKDALGCIGDTAFDLIEPEIPDLELGPDIKVVKGTRVNLSALISGSYKIIDWTSAENLSCYSCTTPSLIPKETLTILCLITNQDGCTAIDSITINVFENKVFAPNAFSPNGDNINDVFTFYGSAHLIRTLEIFDRWGSKVFSKQDFLPKGLDPGWTGRFNDQACMPGVYVYYGIVQFENGEELILKGDVSLIK